jgi:hypothetical protein
VGQNWTSEREEISHTSSIQSLRAPHARMAVGRQMKWEG